MIPGRSASAATRHLLGWLVLPVLAVVNGLVRDTTYGRALDYDLSHTVSVIPLLAFEFGVGALQGLTLDTMLAQYDVTRGKLWPLIPLATLVAPVLMRRWAASSLPPGR